MTFLDGVMMVDYKKDSMGASKENSRSKKKSSTTTTTEQIQAEVMARIVGTFGSVENFQFVQRVLEEQARLEPYRKAMIEAQKQAYWQEKIALAKQNDLGGPIASIVSFDDAYREALRHVKDYRDFLTSNGIDQRTQDDIGAFQRLQSEGAFNASPLQVNTLLEVPPQFNAAIAMRAPAQGSKEPPERKKPREEDRAYQIETARLMERARQEEITQGEVTRRAIWPDQKLPEAALSSLTPKTENMTYPELVVYRKNNSRALWTAPQILALTEEIDKRFGEKSLKKTIAKEFGISITAVNGAILKAKNKAKNPPKRQLATDGLRGVNIVPISKKTG